MINISKLCSGSNSKKYFTFAFLLVGLAFIGFIIYSKFYNSDDNSLVETIKTTQEVIEADLLGKGTKQQIQIISGENTIEFKIKSDGKDVVSKIFTDGSITPNATCSAVQLDLNNPKDYLRCDQVVGPHQVETNLLTIHQGNLYTIPSGDFKKKVWYEPFWTTRDNLVIGDVNNDGFAEIIEFVSEYPANTPRANEPEIEEISRREFKKQGLSQEIADNSILIANRENYGIGMGRKVIWGIHTFTDNKTPLIRRLIGDEYDQIASTIIGANHVVVEEFMKNENNPRLTEIIKVTDLNQESIDFNNFVRNFFTHARSYEYPMD